MQCRGKACAAFYLSNVGQFDLAECPSAVATSLIVGIFCAVPDCHGWVEGILCMGGLCVRSHKWVAGMKRMWLVSLFQWAWAGLS
jgi:hypothetical protein